MQQQDALACKVALITGASRGIGFAIARRLGQMGTRVCICGRDSAKLEQSAAPGQGLPVRPNLFEDVSLIGMLEYLILMEKIAETQVPIHELIGRRWSPRAFSERPVEPDKLLSLFEAARWAASASNEQPWAFLVASQQDPKNFEDTVGVLVEFNRTWASKAPVLILTLAHTQFEKDGRPNRHAFYDLGQAAANLALQATALGLATHPMAGFDIEAARERFAVPEGWEPVSVVALGYPGDLASLTEKLRQRETAQRRRKPLETFVFSGAWGHPAPIAGSA